jgi:hypothetical protein
MYVLFDSFFFSFRVSISVTGVQSVSKQHLHYIGDDNTRQVLFGGQFANWFLYEVMVIL